VGTTGVGGNRNNPVVLRNTSSTQCYLNGAPDLTVVGEDGSVQARVLGADGVGTQFDQYIAAVDILMLVGTPQFADTTAYVDAESLPPGQAFLNILWNGCTLVPAGRLWVDLAGGAGRVVVDFPVAAPDPATCTHQSPLIRDPLKPTGVPWPPAPDYLNLDYSADAPQSIAHGSTLAFYITIANHDSRDYVLTPCPDYAEALVDGPVAYYRLNCDAAGGVVKAGHSVTFEMKFQIPSSTAPGQWRLLWGLVDGTVKPGGIQQPITVT
jgi:hypothetical protein